MILKDKESDLNLSFSINVKGYKYMVSASSESMRYFGCGAEGHQIRSCPGKCGAQSAQPAVAAAAGRAMSETLQSFATAVAGTAPAPAAVVVNTPGVAEPVVPALMEALAEGVPLTVELSPVNGDTNAGLVAEELLGIFAPPLRQPSSCDEDEYETWLKRAAGPADLRQEPLHRPSTPTAMTDRTEDQSEPSCPLANHRSRLQDCGSDRHRHKELEDIVSPILDIVPDPEYQVVFSETATEIQALSEDIGTLLDGTRAKKNPLKLSKRKIINFFARCFLKVWIHCLVGQLRRQHPELRTGEGGKAAKAIVAAITSWLESDQQNSLVLGFHTATTEESLFTQTVSELIYQRLLADGPGTDGPRNPQLYADIKKKAWKFESSMNWFLKSLVVKFAAKVNILAPILEDAEGKLNEKGRKEIQVTENHLDRNGPAPEEAASPLGGPPFFPPLAATIPPPEEPGSRARLLAALDTWLPESLSAALNIPEHVDDPTLRNLADMIKQEVGALLAGSPETVTKSRSINAMIFLTTAMMRKFSKRVFPQSVDPLSGGQLRRQHPELRTGEGGKAAKAIVAAITSWLESDQQNSLVLGFHTATTEESLFTQTVSELIYQRLLEDGPGTDGPRNPQLYADIKKKAWKFESSMNWFLKSLVVKFAAKVNILAPIMEDAEGPEKADGSRPGGRRSSGVRSFRSRGGAWRPAGG
ncbi:unnamed protein product [Tetraodon nigroviridis]|uniref:(spotted green pufferfish) hypothetical protein n=1 Tax=Tetraodon nigroviridis TaxID=99883 RepID=Q4TA96_TETNG|nr:unnamed protein product [Tetraodon nigroviridis]